MSSSKQRRLAAIMFTDMVGYTALGQRNESLSLATVEEQRKIIRPALERHNGREIKTMGDGFLVEFSSAVDAVRCAYDIQRATREFNISLPEERRFQLRIGLHLGEIVESQGDISGDAVNVASRIEHLAQDGGVCLTRQVYDHVQNKFDVPLKSIGTKSLKNVNSPLEVFKMVLPWAEQPSGPVKRLDARRIAVLPFANMSPDPNDSYFADGVTEEIISTLSGVSGLSVISRTSIMGYKGTTKKMKEIGTELEAGSILEGSFRKSGNKIRVTTQLIAVSDDLHIWAQSYDRNLDDVFTVQSDIAKQVADALKVRILTREIDRIDKKPTESANAYALYLRGRYHWNRRNVDDIKKAAEYFEQSINDDAGFALGYVGLADCYTILATNYDIQAKINFEKAKKTLDKALELDANLPEAHASRGLVLSYDFNFREAEDEFRKAIDLKPNYASAHQWYFPLLLIQLRWDEALNQIEKAVELDPFSQIINLNHAGFYESRRDHAKALELAKKASELDPNYAPPHIMLFHIYGNMRKFDLMRKEAEIVSGLYREIFPLDLKVLEAEAAYFEGDKEKLRRFLPELEARLGESPGANSFNIAGLYFYLDEKDKGFELLERSYSRRDSFLPGIRLDEYFDGIRSDPRYQHLLAKLGLG